MTVVAIDRVDSAPNYDGPLPHLIVVADSRISNSGTPSTETAPKIFPINVVAGTADGLLASFPYFGFAYAGSTLAANVTHATASHCLTNLFSSGPLFSPWTLDVARVYQAAARLQMHELGSRLTDPHGALFSGIVFGYSQLSARVQAFKLTPRLHPSFEVDLEEILVSSTHYSFGDGAASFADIRGSLATETHSPDSLHVVSTMIQKDTVRSVGGFVQVALVNRTGCHFPDLLDFKGEEKMSVVRYLGVDLATIPTPTGYTLGRYAMALQTQDGEIPDVGTLAKTIV